MALIISISIFTVISFILICLELDQGKKQVNKTGNDRA